MKYWRMFGIRAGGRTGRLSTKSDGGKFAFEGMAPQKPRFPTTSLIRKSLILYDSDSGYLKTHRFRDFGSLRSEVTGRSLIEILVSGSQVETIANGGVKQTKTTVSYRFREAEQAVAVTFAAVLYVGASYADSGSNLRSETTLGPSGCPQAFSNMCDPPVRRV